MVNDLKAGLNALCGHCPKDVSMGESCASPNAVPETPEAETADTPSASYFPKKNPGMSRETYQATSIMRWDMVFLMAQLLESVVNLYHTQAVRFRSESSSVSIAHSNDRHLIAMGVGKAVRLGNSHG